MPNTKVAPAAVASATPLPTHYNGVPVVAFKVGDPVPSTPGTVAVRIEPDLAKDWLTRYADPRKRAIRDKRVAEYADDMARGGWLWGTSIITFTINGGVQLDNGHHRLTAIGRAGVPVWMMVTTGAEPAVRSVTDIGITRTGGDNIRMSGDSTNFGKEFPNEKGAYIKMFLIYGQTVGTGIAWRPSTPTVAGIATPTKRSVHDTWQADPLGWHTVALAVTSNRRYISKGVPPKTVGAFIYLAEQKHPGEGVKFFQDMTAGTQPDAFRALINLTTGRPTSSGTQLEFDRKIMEVLVRAFNAYRAGTTFSPTPHTPFNLSAIK